MPKPNQRRKTSLAQLLASSFPGKRLGALREEEPANTGAVPDMGGGYQSRAFLLWQEYQERSENRSVLDLGAARPETLRYFSARSCQMAVASLTFDEVPVSDTGLKSQLDELRSDRKFSGVLCWDLLNYLEHGALVTLGQWLAERMEPGSVLLACLAVRGPISGAPARYHVVDDATLYCAPTSSKQHESAGLSQHVLTKLWPDFKVERTFLLRNGMQENVMVRA